jgi:nitric oxide reductase subunit C
VHLRPRHLLILLILSSAPLLNACAPAAATMAPTSPEVTNTALFLVSPSATIPPTPAPATTVASTLTAPAITTPTTPATATPTVLPGNAANGAKLFASLPCSSCHDDTHPLPGGIVCPNLGNIATEAARIVKSADYHGKATDAAGYIRESIVNPNAYIVPGANYHAADGQSAMEKDFAQKLTPEQIDDLVAFLMTRQ